MFQAQFQTFDDAASGEATATRVAALRAELQRRGLSGFVLPRADAHQNEYVPPAEERLAWLSGFTGSAGAAIVLLDRAVLFVDGRYTLQARDQIDPALFEIAHLVETPPHRWIEKNLSAGMTLGYDPWLHTTDGAEKLARACATVGAKLVPVDSDPVDAIWTDRPAPPLGKIVAHDLKFAGEDVAGKLFRIRDMIGKLRTDALVVSDPHNIAWTFNIRGSDVAHTPLPICDAIIPKDGRPALYIDGRKLDNAMRSRLEEVADVQEPANFIKGLEALGRAKANVRLDQGTAADALSRIITAAGGAVSRGPDPISAMKAEKNAVAALESFRRDTGLLKDVSFPSISGAGPNGAIVHYRVTKKSNRAIKPGELFLIDSGGQYEDGTTDITRTVVVGEPAADMRMHFTLVLRGHIAIARAIFPDGTNGAQLDTLARQYLWRRGLDFDHGTGHGVGSYLSVHEGPARISKLGTVPLKRGMILSNEPGYYKTGAYGIRIENLVLVVAGPEIAGGERPLNAFETLTLAPIDRRLIDVGLMTPDEIAWLNGYHARVAETLAPLVDKETQGWLRDATRPLS
jgi:Xaa-Pro aminopeptidase